MSKLGPGFTDAEIKILEKNKNTYNVTKHTFHITLKAKEKIVELHRSGLSYKRIIKELGYDPDMLGDYRIKNIIRSTLNEAKSPRGLHEGYTRAPGRYLSKKALEQLDYTPESYAKLKNEVIYLREEVEFLKKISQQAISEKRGE